KLEKLQLIFSLVSLTVLVLTVLNILHPIIPVVLFVVGMAISGKYLKKINQLSLDISKAKQTFQQYYKLFYKIEKTDFKSENLIVEREILINVSEKVSKKIHAFSKAIDALDQRNNLIVGFFGNGFMLWDMMQALRIEKWI